MPVADRSSECDPSDSASRGGRAKRSPCEMALSLRPSEAQFVETQRDTLKWRYPDGRGLPRPPECGDRRRNTVALSAARCRTPVSDRVTLRGLTQFSSGDAFACPQTAEYKSLRGAGRFEGGFCDTLCWTARKSLILNGEMSEWSIEHAWKAKRATDTEALRGTSTHTRSAT